MPSRRMSRNSELASRNRGLLDPVVAGRVLDGGSGPRPEITNQTTSANTTITVSITMVVRQDPVRGIRTELDRTKAAIPPMAGIAL